MSVTRVGEWGRVPNAVSKMKEKLARDTVFLLFLEGDEPHSDWSWQEKAVDFLVQACQPTPALTHVEVFLPPLGDDDDSEAHFATYLGKDADFGSAFVGSKDFYLGSNRENWRAIPVSTLDAVRRFRLEATRHVGSPYGEVKRLFNYPFAVPPLRAFASFIDDSVKAPAHCASLTARCLRRSVPEIELPRPSAWYGPSTLFLELTKASRHEVYTAKREEMTHLKSLVEVEEVDSATAVLLRGSDHTVKRLDTEQCLGAIDYLAQKVSKAIVQDDVAMQRLSQHQLAIAILRYSQINREETVARLAADSAARLAAALRKSVL